MEFCRMRALKLLIITIPIWLLPLSSVFAQEKFHLDLNWRVFDDRNGLPVSQLFDLHQFEDGAIWISGDRYLFEYRGHSFKEFGDDDGFLDYTLFDLHEDDKHRVWCVGMSGKLCYKENEDIVHYQWNDTIYKYLGEAIITGFHVTQDNTVIIGTMRKGILQINDKGYTHWYEKGLAGWKAVVGKGFVVQGMQSGAASNDLHIYRRGSFGKGSILRTPFPISGTMRADFCGGKTYAIGGNRNLFIVNGDSVVQHIQTKGTIISVNAIGKRLWVGLYRKGVEVYEKTSNTYAAVGHYLRNASVSNVMEDKHQGIWASTLVTGLYYSPSQHVMKLNPPASNPVEQFTAMEHCNASIFVGITDGKTIRFTADGVFEAVVDQKGMSVSDITKVPDRDEVYADGGYISKLDCSGKLISDYAENKYVRNAICIYPDTGDAVWIGNHRGVYHFRKGRLIGRSDSLQQPTRINAIGEVANEVMIATNGGPYSLMDGRITENWLTRSVEGIISEFAAYRDGTLISTHNAGLFHVSADRKVKHYPCDALSCKIIHNLMVVNDHFLCMTNQGLLYCTIEGEDIKYSRLDRADGLVSKDVFDAEVLGDLVYISSARGISAVPLDAFESPVHSPITSINSVEIDGKTFDIDSGLIAAGAHDVLISYQGIYYADQNNVEYRYRLIGLDSTWHITDNTSALFKQLPGGAYRFELQARVGEGAWSDLKEESSLTFEIDIRFWQHSWIWYSILGIVLIGSSGLLITGAVKLDKEVFVNYYIRLLRKITPQSRRTDIITVKSVLDGSNVIITVAEIIWIRAARNYIEIETEKGLITVRDNISKIEQRLLAYPDLIRVHRSIIINWTKVEQVHSDHLMIHGLTVNVGKKYMDQFKGRRSSLLND